MKARFDERAKDWDTPLKMIRANKIAEFMKKKLTFKGSLKGLEYGCGTGLLSFALLSQFQQITLADSSEGMLKVLEEKIRASGTKKMTPILLDLMEDPPPAAHFDLIYSLLTFHHVPDTERILNIFHSILTDEGEICIVDLDKEDGSFHGENLQVHHGFDRRELEEKAEKAGFQKIRFETCHSIKKEARGELQEFPLFMMIAQK
ncbi:MAG: class I SAM-dependent methyltransferase [SAR324 cluster bacterium]|nr:class I SAM-dependent methyltransferase [SAR324 cluster bacterium]